MAEEVYFSHEYQDLIVGTHGFEHLDASTTVTANDSKYWRVQATEAATISATSVVGGNLSNVPLAAGDEIRGLFSEVSRTEGSVLVYKKKD